MRSDQSNSSGCSSEAEFELWGFSVAGSSPATPTILLPPHAFRGFEFSTRARSVPFTSDQVAARDFDMRPGDMFRGLVSEKEHSVRNVFIAAITSGRHSLEGGLLARILERSR